MSGCQSTPDRSSVVDTASDNDPQALIDSALTARTTAQAVTFILEASNLYLDRGEPAQALAALDLLAAFELSDGPNQLDDTLHDAIARERATALRRIGQFDAARVELANVQQMSVADYLQTAALCAEIQAHTCAADGYIQAAQKANQSSSDLPSEINDLIWQHLSLARRGPVVFTHPDHHAWWLLQQEMRSANSASGQATAWRAWRDANPRHPANANPPKALVHLESYSSPNIGVFAPLSGPLAGAGQALRNGLISAYLAERNTQKPNIRFYDCNSADLGQLLEVALSDGIDVVVGPLVKENVDKFAAIAEAAQVPTLLLNYVSDDTNAYQFAYQLGIAIEDEAATLAAAVVSAGYEKVLIIHSEAAWSRRAMTRFSELWNYPYAIASYTDIKGITDAVGESMQVAASQARSTRLSRILGESLEFLPRARKDFDAVIALTTQLESRALIPALEFHFANDLPVYATSQSARGDYLAELTGFTVTELPIFAYPTSTQTDMLRAYDLVANPLAELYALGFDAYKVATWLPLLQFKKTLELDAASGYLHLQESGRFQRSLSVNAVHAQGRLTPIDF